MRTCVRLGGQFWAPQKEDKTDDLPLCFFGAAGIGAHALLSFRTGQGPYQAIRVYKTTSGKTCEHAGAVTVRGQDTNGQTFEVCEFRDGSLIERNTLLRGLGSGANAGLDQVLGSTF
ncbi:hypothetical protein [Bdellovibrio sp. HCB2-146]|uniref:hypothetical protein n=1 Tax=Bdellovibrio sp. HCB2-146 TaxID=3394362 RepID=UPI0039BD331F